MTNEYYTVNYGRLWIDGSRSVKPEYINQFVGEKNIYVTEINEEIAQYNELTDTPLLVKEHAVFDESWLTWNIPQSYQDIDIKTFIYDKFVKFAINNNVNEELYMKRINTELKLVTKYNLHGLFKTAIYIVDTFNAHQIVWGVGRGSSVSCFLLYLIGIHDIDSIKYELDYKDFFHI